MASTKDPRGKNNTTRIKIKSTKKGPGAASCMNSCNRSWTTHPLLELTRTNNADPLLPHTTTPPCLRFGRFHGEVHEHHLSGLRILGQGPPRAKMFLPLSIFGFVGDALHGFVHSKGFGGRGSIYDVGCSEGGREREWINRKTCEYKRREREKHHTVNDRYKKGTY